MCNRGKTVNNTKTCAYNTRHYAWQCVRMTLRIMQQLVSKRASTCRWFSTYKKILRVGQQSVLLPIDALRHVLVPAMCAEGSSLSSQECQLGGLGTQMAGQPRCQVSSLTYHSIYQMNCGPWCTKKMDEHTIGFLWKASRLVATSSVLQCHYL